MLEKALMTNILTYLNLYKVKKRQKQVDIIQTTENVVSI